MTCREVTGFPIDYIAGELPPATLADGQNRSSRPGFGYGTEPSFTEVCGCCEFLAQYLFSPGFEEKIE